MLLIRGVLSHTRYHLRARWIKAAFALIVSVLAYNNFIGTPHLMIDIVAPAAIAMVLFTIGAALLLRESSFVYGGNTLAATVSGGLAIYPADDDDWDALFSMADRRL